MYSINDEIKQVHLSEESEYEFEKIESNADSYYLNYLNSSHLDSALIEYDSENMKLMRNRLQKLWGNEDKIKKYIPIVMSALTQKLLDKGELPQIDLYNYMM